MTSTHPPPPGIAGLVLAAGAGTRFGGLKQLSLLDGRPLLEHVLAAMADSGIEHRVVVLGARASDLLERVDLHGARPVVCADWGEGQARSLQAGLDALGQVDGALVVLGDQPLISPEAIRRVAAAPADGSEAARATYDGVPGHPVLLRSAIFDEIRRLRGDAGARDALARARITAVPCDGLGSPADIDVPEDLQRLQG